MAGATSATKASLHPPAGRVFSWLLIVVAGLTLLASGFYVYTRFITDNFHVVVPQKVFRSAQPDTDELQAWTEAYGLKTIVNLCGESSTPSYLEEVDAARQVGAEIVNIRLPNKSLPESPCLMQLADVLEEAEKPLLLHCSEGADRTCLASVMARMAVGGKSYDRAKEQMSIRFLHVDQDPEHIAGVLRQYEQYARLNQTGTGGWREFRHWLFHVYNPSYRYVSIQGPGRLAAGPGEEVRATVRIKNRSALVIPAGDPRKRFAVAVISGRPFREKVEKEFGPPIPLPKADIEPGGLVTVELTFAAPLEIGAHRVYFDLIEDGTDYFSHDGSPLGFCDLVVTKEP